MRDIVFLLADKAMEATFSGFLSRDGFHHSLGIKPFRFDPKEDIFVDPRNDPGVYIGAHELLRPFLGTHQHAVAVLDEEWEGTPGVEQIRESIRTNLMRNGWEDDRAEVIVIDPELEAWIWQDSIHVAREFSFDNFVELKGLLTSANLWPEAAPKPARPKEAIELALKYKRIPRSSAIYKKIVSQVSVRGCVDPAFILLRDTLQKWYPQEI